MAMHVGRALLDLGRATGARSIFIVGTGKNVGKTVTMRAVYDAALQCGLRLGLTSTGRDGEAIDVGDAQPKPRLFLRSGTIVATARDVLPRTPASEIVALTDIRTAASTLVFARVRHDAFFELVGAPTAAGQRSVVERLRAYADFAIVDGAVDRIAALAGGDDAIVVACGASAASSFDDAVEDVRGLIHRLQIERYDGLSDALWIEGALTAADAAALLAARERRVVVLRDPTRLALSGASAAHVLERLTVRCVRPLRVVAVTVSSIGRERRFEPRAFAHAVARATGLPTFDVYASERAA